MENRTLSLFFTLLLGVFIVIGVVLSFFFKKNRRLFDFIFSLAFSIIIMLIALDLLPEIISCFGLKQIWLFLIFSILGFFFFKLLDSFLPDHEEEGKSKKEEEENNLHIGRITTFALTLHNVIEGMALYFIMMENAFSGVMMGLGVGLHNIPLGIMISSTLYQEKTKEKDSSFYLFLLILSPFIGGLIPFLFKFQTVNSTLMGILLSLTLGMLCYISFCELLPKVLKAKEKRLSIYGIVMGILLLLCTMFF